jgi:hypothetical protein
MYTTYQAKKIHCYDKVESEFHAVMECFMYEYTFWTLVICTTTILLHSSNAGRGATNNLTSHVNMAIRMLYIAAPIYCIAWIVVIFEGNSVYAYQSLKGWNP